jgi:glycolate oxidase FAD binding subunit
VSTHLRPSDAKTLTDMVGFLVARKASTEIIGAGTKRAIGRPTNTEYQLDVSAIAEIREYDPNELVMTCGAGTPMWAIESALADANQQLAFEPMDYGPLLGGPVGRGTIGGVLAANLSGPRRFKAGAARDHFLGVAAVSGRGEAFKAGGKVVKNVTGYDMCKLLAGSWGTLAVMHEVTVKVLPAPEETVTLVLHGLTVAQAVEAMTTALHSPHEISGAAHLPATQETLLRIEGFPQSVIARLEALTSLLANSPGKHSILDAATSIERWKGIRDVAPLNEPMGRPVWRLSLPPASASAVWQELIDQVAVDGFLDWAGGLIWLATDPASPDGGADAIRTTLNRTQGGHATLIRGTAGLRSGISVFPPTTPGVAALQQRVRAGFDPHDVLNPGRLDI